MDELIARLESAPEGNEELDEAILDCVHAKALIETGAVKTAEGWRHPEYGKIAIQYYSTSIDAALSLIPEEWTAWGLCSRRGRKSYVATISRLVKLPPFPEETYETGSATTPALALCVVALKAHQWVAP